jgi:hypothetical protein
MDKALKEGRFTNCIKQYANMGGGQIAKNPIVSLLFNFSSIALNNHLDQKRNKKAGNTPPKATEKRPEGTAPSYVQPSKNPPATKQPEVHVHLPKQPEVAAVTPPQPRTPANTYHLPSYQSDAAGGASRPRLTEGPSFIIPTAAISSSLNKFTPVLKHVQNNMAAADKIEKAREVLSQSEIGPVDL